MSKTVRKNVKGRLTYLWTFELVGAVLFSLLVWLWWERAELGAATAVGLGLTVLLLAQGSFYWYAKLRSIRRQPMLSDRAFVRLFTSLRTTNQVLLLAVSVTGLASVIGTRGTFSLDLGIGAGLWALAVLEYVNYFHRQLMYDSPSEVRWLLCNRRLKVARLRKDLAAGGL